MRLPDIIKTLGRIFEKKKKNPVHLSDDSNLESNLKPLKVSDKNTPIEISENTVDVKGSLKVNGIDVSTQLNDLSDVTYSSGDLLISSLDTIKTSGELTLNAVGEDIVFKGNGTERFRFVLDSTPELRLVGNSKIDSSGTLEIECTGALTLDATHGFTSPNTPCFSAYNSSLDQDLTADGSTYTTIDFNTEVFDVGTNYASDTFTAPVAGKYFFTTGVTVRNQDTDKWVMIQIHTSGGSYSTWGWQHNTYDDYTTHTVSCLVDLSASETAIVRGKAEAGGTDGDYDIIGGAAYTYFQGYRVA